jgi:aminoglycoside phosphotransferase (APT) family kinase protein
MTELSGSEAGRDLVRRGVPAVEGKPVRVLGTGQFNNAYLVEDRVVRVPKSQIAVDGLRREVAFLAVARDHLRATAPLILTAELGGGADDAFVVHRLIRGDLLREEWLGETGTAELDRIASAVALFVQSLWGIALTQVAVERHDLGSWWARLAADVETEVMPHLKPDVGARIVADLHTAAPDVRGADVVCHGDLGGNLLWGADGLGVIDFASCSIGHPAVDLASLLVLGDRFVEALLNAAPTFHALLEAAQHIRRSFLAQDLLWSVRQGDLELVNMIAGRS